MFFEGHILNLLVIFPLTLNLTLTDLSLMWLFKF